MTVRDKTMKRHGIEIPDERLSEFCQRYQIVELALVGSVLRDDFRPGSDVDFLVTYAPDKRWEPWGDLPEQEEMEALIGRKVDWLTRKSLEQGNNPLFRRAVLSRVEVLYAAR
jgi:predicted nucleotidyltransferase